MNDLDHELIEGLKDSICNLIEAEKEHICDDMHTAIKRHTKDSTFEFPVAMSVKLVPMGADGLVKPSISYGVRTKVDGDPVQVSTQPELPMGATGVVDGNQPVGGEKGPEPLTDGQFAQSTI
ncbi:hypothetical protein [Pararhizobium sp.]|uniref:hypothetical protein n=1 Tax=Pararhizobium sp. TaxID=1977563 RepID=UPI003D0DE5B9